jgi:trimeric autotransporter adhesin
MANTKAFKVKNGLELGAISDTISDTAVDVFVYDTSKDSDGGAWRKRTQGTSWYNETLNTATRGSRKEFPAVAVIVAEATQVTIYDGDDPDLPMWMVFNEGTANYIYSNGDALTSVNASNGMLVVGTFRLQVINFVSDSGWKSEDNWYYYSVKPISSRNDTNTTAYNNTGPRIVNTNVRDVAMTVLPNAPIDAATGLPVPTIAVATGGGVSVIKDDGTVVDVTGGIPNSISFTKENRLFFDCDIAAGGSRAFRALDIPSVDTNLTLAAKPAGSQYYTTAIFADTYPEDIAFLNGYAAKAVPNAIGFRTGTSHLALIAPKPDDNTKAMIAFVTSDYNTGWQNGAIKLATLSDTDDTDVTGSELVTNGTFDSDVSGWTVTSNGTFTYSSGSAILEQVTGSNASAYQSITTVVGKRYVASCDVTGVTSRILIGTSSSSGDIGASGFFSNTTITLDFVATSTTTFFSLQGGGTVSGQQTTVDNISVRLAEEDRSVNGNGLQVFGTVTKNPVATGADLVAYSGFSASNYLEQPYNSDLDFGTGDFCVMGWVKVNSSYSGTDYILSRGTNLGYAINVYSGLIEFIADAVGVTKSFPSTDNWFFIACGVRGGYRYISVNAQAETTSVITTSVDEANASLIFGVFSAAGAAPFDGSLALLRISATAPTAEQIAKIYNDEKVLFQENAQATLYGSSDAVTALAYDDTTELLHVGTSAGRSDFQGLRRVNNTTNAVGAAISASNGMIVEE